jgi:hypothetical protein
MKVSEDAVRKLTQMENEAPTLFEVKQLTRDYGLVGEEDTVLVVFLSYLKGGFVAMTGLSRSGKDHVVDAANFAMPGDEVYPIPTSTSKTYLFEQEYEMNQARVHRYPDITTLDDKPHLEDMMKRHGEGEAMTHSRTIGGGGATESMTIYPPDCFIMFVATDNEKVDLNDYAELRNRALIVSVDASAELTERVNEMQAKMEAGMYERKVSRDEAADIRDYIASIPVEKYGEDGDWGTQNPVAIAINNQNPLPSHFTEARQDFPRLMDFMRSVAMFHAGTNGTAMEAPLPDKDETLTLLITPKDAWMAMRIFGEKMVLSALNLRDEDFEILEVLREDLRNDGGGLSKAEVQMEMRDRGFNITNSDVARALDNMLTKGYVRKDQGGSPVLWSAAPFAKEATRNVNMNWKEIVEDTKETARASLPDGVADEYIENHCQGEGLIATHPFTGETINITESNELEEKVEEREEQEADVFSEGLYGESTSEDDGEEAESTVGGELQGTLGD